MLDAHPDVVDTPEVPALAFSLSFDVNLQNVFKDVSDYQLNFFPPSSGRYLKGNEILQLE